MIRIGHGYDVHRFGVVENSASITLGGCSIAYERPLLAHSDGDVLIHALCDAILGALCLGDIGKHFPDTDMEYKNTDSKFFLAEIKKMLDDKYDKYRYYINDGLRLFLCDKSDKSDPSPIDDVQFVGLLISLLFVAE